jgi:5-methylcytosine-specific restriction endonuclease McrA
LEKQRELAEAIKRKIQKDHPCPYCNKELGNNAHADHIYPISRGGLSIEWNMIFVCEPCNLNKRDMPLFEFILKHRLDAANILRTLRALGKKV